MLRPGRLIKMTVANKFFSYTASLGLLFYIFFEFVKF